MSVKKTFKWTSEKCSNEHEENVQMNIKSMLKWTLGEHSNESYRNFQWTFF